MPWEPREHVPPAPTPSLPKVQPGQPNRGPTPKPPGQPGSGQPGGQPTPGVTPNVYKLG